VLFLLFWHWTYRQIQTWFSRENHGSLPKIVILLQKPWLFSLVVSHSPRTIRRPKDHLPGSSRQATGAASSEDCCQATATAAAEDGHEEAAAAAEEHCPKASSLPAGPETTSSKEEEQTGHHGCHCCTNVCGK